MVLRLLVGAALGPAWRRSVTRARRSLMRYVALAGIFTVGIGLLLASALLALSAWLGPIAATGVAGCTLLVAGGLLSLVMRRHPDREAETVPLPTPLDPAKGGLALPILGLGLGLALSALLVRRPN